MYNSVSSSRLNVSSFVMQYFLLRAVVSADTYDDDVDMLSSKFEFQITATILIIDPSVSFLGLEEFFECCSNLD